MKKKLYIGAHTSAAGGVHNALLEGEGFGATTIQFFTSNQKTWKARTFTQEDLDLWFEAKESTGLEQLMSHDSYLINLGSPKEEGLIKSRHTFQKEVERCVELDLSYLNFHPGAALDGDRTECMDRIAESLIECEKGLEGSNLRLLLETTAGQGSNVGYRFEEIGYILDQVKDKVPVGVCIDTCHIFAAGYDIRDKKGWDATLKEFDKHIGLEHLYAFHVNDSLKELGSRRDRHANLGEGEIGIECFKVMMTHPKMKWIPKYLETPNGAERWTDEIKMLFAFARQDS